MPPVMVLIFGTMFAGKHPASEHPVSPEMLFPGIMAYLVLILMGPAYNCFAFEGRGIQTYFMAPLHFRDIFLDRKSTRLNSSHGYISYAVFCLKKKKTISTHALCRLHL